MVFIFSFSFKCKRIGAQIGGKMHLIEKHIPVNNKRKTDSLSLFSFYFYFLLVTDPSHKLISPNLIQTK